MSAAAIPESIKVGAFVYAVMRQAMDDFGQNDARRLIITIADDLAPVCERETLLHEIMHVRAVPAARERRR